MDVVNSIDSFHKFRKILHKIAQDKSEWAGIPMPLEGQPFVVEPRYPLADIVQKVNETVNPPKPDDEVIASDLIRGSFWSTRYKRTVFIVWHDDGKSVFKVMVPGENAFNMAIRTAHASEAWGVEQESKALQLLGGMLPHHLFKAYLLTGMFPETSKRSGVTYLFRRLRPTVAMRLYHKTNESKFLAALCMHPLGYYADTWAGAMCPTDEVVAHLVMMRGDEPRYWRMANQHGRDKPQAGL